MRRILTIGCLVTGVVLMVVGYMTSAPWGTESVANSDPNFPFAPTLFVLGVVIAFSSALVYELLPDKRRP